MFPTLIESEKQTNKKRFLGVGLVSLTIHVAAIAGAVYSTLHAARSDDTVRVDTTAVLLAPQNQPKQAVQEPLQLEAPLKGFQTVAVPAEIPTDIPAIDLQEHFDPKDYSGTGVEGGRAKGTIPGDDQVYLESVVQERPFLLSGPPPYPALLREAGIHGRVVLRAIIDTTGRLEPSSIKILETPSHAFDRSIREWALTALFRPARMQGRAVRALVRLPLDYSVTTP